MSFNSDETPVGARIRATRREHLHSALIRAARTGDAANSFILARALEGLDLRQLEHLIDEIDETFFGTKPASKRIPDQKPPSQ